MPSAFISPIYVAILSLFFLYLSLRVVKKRGEKKVSIGDGGHNELQLSIRAHANFAEYVPLGLFLLFSLDAMRERPWIVHVFGIMLVVARVLHFLGVSKTSKLNRFRLIGASLTFTMIALSSATVLISFLQDHL